MANGSQKDDPRDDLMTKYLGLITITLVSLIFLFTCSAIGEEKKVVQVLRLEGPISPVAADRLDKALKVASQEKAQCLVIKLDTPGGLDKSMRQMVKAIMNSHNRKNCRPPFPKQSYNFSRFISGNTAGNSQ